MAQHPFTTNRWLNANHLQENENWHIARNEQNEVTSFCYVPNKEIRSIFLGSFPIFQISEGDNQGNLEFFYGSCENKFWPILNSIFNLPINNVSDRINLAIDLKIGITDILLNIDRELPESSNDKFLQAIPTKYNNIVQLLYKFPTIKNIFITSGGRAAIPNLIDNNNGNRNVGTWLRDSLNEHLVQGFNQNGFVKEIRIDNSILRLIYLYSPSDNVNIPISGILNRNNNFGIPNMNINLFRRYQWEYFIKKHHFNQVANIPQVLINFFEQ